MRILVTNDDGIEAEGIRILVEWAKKLGEVTVSAPKTQQSAKSHAINVHTPIEIRKVDLFDGIEAYSVDSTPVDCVRFATLGLNRQYDLVLSGINKGFNLGEDILYSGTVAAIFETSLRALRGIALSTEYTTFETAEKYLDEVYNYFVKNDLFAYNDVFNVNIPLEVKDVLVTKMGGAYFTDEFIQVDEHHFDQQGYSVYQYGNNLQLDTDATMNGYISITPLTTKRDNVTAWEKIIERKQ